MSYDLSAKVVGLYGQPMGYEKEKKTIQHDLLTMVVEALWSAGSQSMPVTVKRGVLADRLGLSPDHAVVELSSDNVTTIVESMEQLQTPPILVFQVLKVIDPDRLGK